MIELAAKHNLLVFLDPIETGGWLTNMVNNGPEACNELWEVAWKTLPTL